METELVSISERRIEERGWVGQRVWGRYLRRHWNQVLAWIVVLLFLLGSALPIYWLVLTAFRPRDEIFAQPVILTPRTLSLVNVREVLLGAINNDPLLRYLITSLIISVIATVFATTLGVMCAYGIVRFQVGGTFLPMWILSQRFFPPIAVVVPLFFIYKRLGLLDTYHGLILLYIVFNIPLAVWLMIGFIRSLPVEIEEAALVEGASYWQAFVKVTLPLLRPGLAITALFVFIFCWNEYVFAYQLAGSDVVPVTVYFPRLRTGHMLFFGGLAAASLLSLIPSLAFAWGMQRYLVRGLTLGGIK
ncbi:MAG TPA: carbohydrate ABC transporter permease [Caldilineae bacterium]|nr:carbohydrate ABC transporter permease [Caldilineae bacterium]